MDNFKDNIIDWEYYLDKYTDLRINGVNTKEQALQHWNTHGKIEKRQPYGKLFDCFTFFNELELLELRLMELYDIVDYFVIVEANKTHTYKEKDFIFEKNKEQFKPYLDKIIYIKVSDLPSYSVNDIWAAENFQRNCIMRGVDVFARKGDRIIISDIDEIPNSDTIKENIISTNWITFRQTLYYYYVNCKQNCLWDGPIMAPYGTFDTPQQLRNFARFGQNYVNNGGWHYVNNGGWHYSFMGGCEKIRLKVENIAESHLIIDNVGDIDQIKEKILHQKDLWNRTDDYAIKTIVDITYDKPKKLDVFLQKYPNFLFTKKL